MGIIDLIVLIVLVVLAIAIWNRSRSIFGIILFIAVVYLIVRVLTTA